MEPNQELSTWTNQTIGQIVLSETIDTNDKKNQIKLSGKNQNTVGKIPWDVIFDSSSVIPTPNYIIRKFKSKSFIK